MFGVLSKSFKNACALISMAIGLVHLVPSPTTEPWSSRNTCQIKCLKKKYMWSLLRSLEGIQIVNLLRSVWQYLFTRDWLFSLWEFSNQVRKSESTDHNKSITYLKVIAEGTHQNSSLEKKTQKTFICFDEDAQGNSNVIIRGVQKKKNQDSGQMKIIWTWGVRWRWDSAEHWWKSRARYTTPSKQLVVLIWLQEWSCLWEALGWGFLSSFWFYLNFKVEAKMKEHGLVGGNAFHGLSHHRISPRGGSASALMFSVHNKPKPKTAPGEHQSHTDQEQGHGTRI